MHFTDSFVLFAQNDAAGAAGGAAALAGGLFCMVIWMIIVLAPTILVIAGLWKTFEKAGKPGWAAIVPIYNLIVMLEVVGKPMWWIVLALIPCTAPVFGIIISIDLAKCFGKDVVWGLGLAFLGIIFFPMLGFGSAQYIGPIAGGGVAPQPQYPPQYPQY